MVALPVSVSLAPLWGVPSRHGSNRLQGEVLEDGVLVSKGHADSVAAVGQVHVVPEVIVPWAEPQILHGHHRRQPTDRARGLVPNRDPRSWFEHQVTRGRVIEP